MKDIFEKSTNDSKNKELHSSIIELMWHYNLYQRWLMVWECNWFDGGITYKLQKHYIIRVAFFMRKIIVNLFLSLLTLFCQWQECPRLGLEKSQLLQKVLSSFCLVVHWMSISLLQALVTIIVAGTCSWQRKTIKKKFNNDGFLTFSPKNFHYATGNEADTEGDFEQGCMFSIRESPCWSSQHINLTQKVLFGDNASK